MRIFATLVMTLAGLVAGGGLAALSKADRWQHHAGENALITAVGCLVGAGVGLWFGRLIAGPPAPHS